MMINSIKSILIYFFPHFKKIEIGKKYIHESNIGAFNPLVYIPKKMNKTHVLYDFYQLKCGDGHLVEGEDHINNFKSSFVLYDTR